MLYVCSRITCSVRLSNLICYTLPPSYFALTWDTRPPFSWDFNKLYSESTVHGVHPYLTARSSRKEKTQRPFWAIFFVEFSYCGVGIATYQTKVTPSSLFLSATYSRLAQTSACLPKRQAWGLQWMHIPSSMAYFGFVSSSKAVATGKQFERKKKKVYLEGLLEPARFLFQMN